MLGFTGKALSQEDLRVALLLIEGNLLEESDVSKLLGELLSGSASNTSNSLRSLLLDRELLEASDLERLLPIQNAEATCVLPPQSSEEGEQFLKQVWDHRGQDESKDPDEDEEQLGRFEGVEFLAEGAMGKVLRATDPEIGREVAIKVLHPEQKGHWEAIGKFRREASLTGRLDHPNIVPVYDMGQSSDGSYYFVMKLVSGRSLAEELREIRLFMEPREDRYDGRHLLGAFQKICDAVAFAHSRKIIHRDLKPANFMVGAFGEVLVMDWGLAKDIEEEEEAFNLNHLVRAQTRKIDPRDHGMSTMDGSVLGTPAYMPPEQAAGKIADVDERSDIYALGATLYEILALSPPFMGANPLVVLSRVQETPLVPPGERSKKADVPRELEAVVMKAMAKEPRDRYQSVTELQADIEAYREGRVLSVVQYSLVQRGWKWIGRHRAASGVAGIALIGFVVYLATAVWLEARRIDEAFGVALTESNQRIKEVGKIEDWMTVGVQVNPVSGLMKRELPEEKVRRERAIQVYLEAAEQLEKALALRPGSRETRNQRIWIGKAVGQMALVGRDGLLAREAFRRLAHFGEKREVIEELLVKVDAMESEVLEWRQKRLETILEDIGQGLSRERPNGAPLLEDYVLEAVRYRDPQTVEILWNDLRELIEKVIESPRDSSIRQAFPRDKPRSQDACIKKVFTCW